MKNPAFAQFIGVSPETEFSPFTGTRALGPNHTPCIWEGGELKVTAVPFSSGGQWAKAPQSLRSSTYHDPVLPGTVKVENGKRYKWVDDQGYVETGDVSPIAKYRSDGTVETAGWLPDGRYAEADGTIWRPADGAGVNVDDAVNEFIGQILTAYGVK